MRRQYKAWAYLLNLFASAPNFMSPGVSKLFNMVCCMALNPLVVKTYLSKQPPLGTPECRPLHKHLDYCPNSFFIETLKLIDLSKSETRDVGEKSLRSKDVWFERVALIEMLQRAHPTIYRVTQHSTFHSGTIWLFCADWQSKPTLHCRLLKLLHWYNWVKQSSYATFNP